MKLVKITSDKIQIRTDQKEFEEIRINDLLSISDIQVTLITMVTSITDIDADMENYEFIEFSSKKTIECMIIGSLKEKLFTKSILKYPITDVVIRKLDKIEFSEMLKKYKNNGFCIGKYTEYNCPAYVDGNKFFQKHVCIVGNTGSGKSETVAKILEESKKLKNTNMIVFDIHGEYSKLSYVKNFKIGEDFSFPIWMFSFSDIIANILKIKEESSTIILTALRKCYYKQNPEASENQPCYFNYSTFVKELEKLNEQETHNGEFYKSGAKEGMPKMIKGDYNGKLLNVINIFKDKQKDSRYHFLFQEKTPEYLQFVIEQILKNDKPVKNIDLSKIPYDVVIMVIGALTKLIYNFQKFCKGKNPLVLVCDEAHVYIPNNFQLSASEQRMIEIFENIAKEGRKFGITLLPATQRPSELNKTILAQCSNFVVSKLNNENDKIIIKGMLPDGNEKLIDSVSMFNPGEVIIIGDAVPIPLKIQVELAKERPESRTIEFWDIWNQDNYDINSLIKDYLSLK